MEGDVEALQLEDDDPPMAKKPTHNVVAAKTEKKASGPHLN